MQKDFFQDVYEVVKLIPYGRVTSYGAIAVYLGEKMSARMVGYALNALSHHDRNPVPAHRVVNRKGELSGHLAFQNPSMQQRLEAEGVEVVDMKVLDFEGRFWSPSEELRLG